MKKVFLPAAILIFAVTAFIISCQKGVNSNNSGAPHLRVYLTDAPASYDKVLVDVKDVQINLTNDSTSGWQSLSNVAVGTYDLLDLVNGNDTLLADSNVPVGTINQVRLVLGSNNAVVINGTTYPLTTPSGQQSGLKVNVHQRINSGLLYNLVLDFDAARSIVKTGNNRYILKPVIRANFELTAGRIKGVVTPDSVTTSVLAIIGTDTAGTFTDSQGNYLIGGLRAGTYTLFFFPTNTAFFDEQRNGINVTPGTITVADTVHLHQ